MSNNLPNCTDYPDKLVIGVDEAGRGCMWGSVFAGAVILPEDLTNEEVMTDTEKRLLRDSKKLSEKRRIEAVSLIHSRAIAYGVGECTASEIDRQNILRATHTSMHRAIDECIHMALTKYPGFKNFEIRVDGNSFRMYQEPIEGDVIPHECVIGGDASDRAIAAASILAKTGRDSFVKVAVDVDPSVNEKWEMLSHKGYCTKKHMNAIQEHGIHDLHRKSYAPIKRVLGIID
jgi:ribonuclease HII